MGKYVIQLHDASHLHFDFRLEIGGVLKSWVLPKGPSLNPAEKRLAVLTEDHSLSYGSFEGVISEGEYGAGTVMLWDRGSFRNLNKEHTLEKSLKLGKLDIFIRGKKLMGGYALVRMKEKNWLLIKKNDEFANRRKDVVKSMNRSVKSERTLFQIKTLQK